jgi:hypothetical protein
MIHFNNCEKRWLEIFFYLLCRKIFSINQKNSDITDFIQGFRWTNMFNYAKLINVIKTQKILLNDEIKPSKHELLIAMEYPNCRLKVHPTPIFELIRDTEYTYERFQRYRAKMKEEVNPTELFPKMNVPDVHETIYSFLLAIRYVADLVKKIKF